MSWPLVKYVLTAAVRDRLIASLAIILILGSSLSIFMGSSAIAEKGQFAVVFAAGGLRIAGVLGLVLFAVFFIRRSFDARDVEFLLSRPVGRTEFLVSYAIGFSILAILMGLAEGICLYLMGPQYFNPGHIDWIISILIENVVMVNTALFFAMILSSAASAAMAAAAFYVLARMMGQLLGIIDAREQLSWFYNLAEFILQSISAVMPRLDLLGQSSWLVYGPDANMHFPVIIVQCGIFSVLVLTAAIIDLVRRQF